MRDPQERIAELIEAGNRYLERARAAERAIAHAPDQADELIDKIEGLKAELDAALDIIDRRGDAGAREWLRMNYPNRQSATELFVCSFRVGDRVEKVGGDYTFAGIVRAVFTKESGAVRLVVEDDRGVLHVYSEKNLRAAPTATMAISIADRATPALLKVGDALDKIGAATKPRALKHGEYRPGDRVRYVGRSKLWNQPGDIGDLATVREVSNSIVFLTYDKPKRCHSPGVYPENIEHESLPQFEAGDRVRVKDGGLPAVSDAAGREALIAISYLDSTMHLRFDEPIANNYGTISQEWHAERHQVELVRPFQAGGAP